MLFHKSANQRRRTAIIGGHAVDVLKVAGDDEVERKLADAGFEPVAPEDLYVVD